MSGTTNATPPASGPVLRDIHLPPEPSWWPPAPGWWIVGVLVLLAVSFAFWFWRRRRQQRAIERVMLAELDGLVAQWRGHPSRLVAGLHQLLRRGALRYDTEAGQRQGNSWRRTLAQVPADQSTLDQLMALELLMYRPDVTFDVEAAVAATRRWLVLAWRQPAIKKSALLSSAHTAQESGHA
ncbi:DUF4381 domain-containing protein [Dyella sp. 20L07]|uniref:DUF4381 domain-containing protein n=1 Tax=Dyella sp. 20L07 TaxID=3384240 RepID=UPI003D27C0A0